MPRLAVKAWAPVYYMPNGEIKFGQLFSSRQAADKSGRVSKRFLDAVQLEGSIAITDEVATVLRQRR